MSCSDRRITGLGFCGNIAPATPNPIPASCNTLCPEDHTQQIVVNKFNATLIIKSPWNVPACNESVVVYVEGLTNIQLGSYLWNSVYGYFKVTGFNADTSEITLQNLCNKGNAAPGTEVSECTDFTVSDPPGPSTTNNTDGFPYIASNFTSQNSGDCIDVQVTTTNGLIAGALVQIWTGEYRISAIPDATSITICNDGNGITPGTPVVAQNGAGEYQYPISLVAVNPCATGTSTTGSLIICSSGSNRLLGALNNGQVPVVVDAANSIVQFQDLDVLELTCNFLSSTFFIVAGTASYILTLTSTSGFTAGDTLTIDGRSERFGVNVVIDSTHLQVTMYPIPSANGSVAAGAKVCNAFDCEDTQFPTLLVGESGLIASLGNPTIDSSTAQPYVSTPITLAVTNTSKCRSTRVGVTATGKVSATIDGSNTDPFSIGVILNGYVVGASPIDYPIIWRPYAYSLDTSPVLFDTLQTTYTGPLITTVPPATILALGPQETRSVEFRLHIYHSGSGGWSYAVSYSTISVLLYNLAV